MSNELVEGIDAGASPQAESFFPFNPKRTVTAHNTLIQ